MIPFHVMLVAMLLARGAGALGVELLDDWPSAVRFGLAVMFLFTATAHFNRYRADLIRTVPPGLPSPATLVTLTGLAEFLGALALLIPWTARLAAYGLILLLIVMFSANVHAARRSRAIGGRPPTPLPIRAPLQALWIFLLWWSIP